MAKIKSVTLADNMHWAISNGGQVDAAPGKLEISSEGQTVHLRFLVANQMSHRLGGMHVEIGSGFWKYCVYEDEPPATKKDEPPAVKK